MILRLTCPDCRNDSYSSSVEDFKPCPYCGLVFSGRYGPEQRQEHRIRKEMHSILSYKGKTINARTLSISNNGLSLKIQGQESLPVGGTIDININNSPLKAKVIWSFHQPGDPVDLVGAKIIEGTLNFLS
jgi:hypothetical protein